MMCSDVWNKYLKKYFIKEVVVIKEIEIIKEVPVIELGLNRELITELKRLYPRRMFAQGMNLEHFAENAGQYHIILHLEKILDKSKTGSRDITKRL